MKFKMFETSCSLQSKSTATCGNFDAAIRHISICNRKLIKLMTKIKSRVENNFIDGVLCLNKNQTNMNSSFCVPSNYFMVSPSFVFEEASR